MDNQYINNLLKEKKYLESLLLYYYRECNDSIEEIDNLNKIALQIEDIEKKIICYYIDDK
jgi:hypothetical protein